jgi:hypothetical protein
MLKLRDTIPSPQPLAKAEFTTLRLRLVKIVARIIETVSRVRVAFAAHPRRRCSPAWRAAFNPPDHDTRGQCAPIPFDPANPSAQQIRSDDAM